MPRKADVASAKQRVGSAGSSNWLTSILAQPDKITDGAWKALQPPKPTNAAEKKALQRELEIGGRNVTIYEVSKQILIELMDSTALKLLLAIEDPERVKKATVQQLSVAMGILIDKAQLLRGQPTAIYRHEDVRKLDELGAALMKEMQRRGITVDGEVVAEGDD